MTEENPFTARMSDETEALAELLINLVATAAWVTHREAGQHVFEKVVEQGQVKWQEIKGRVMD